MLREYYWSLHSKLRHEFRKPMPDFEKYQALVRGKVGLEIGGPTALFVRDLPLYKMLKSLDGVNFSSTTVWAGRIADGAPYRYLGRRAGRQFILDATDLTRLPAESYDVVLSSNNLEHVANPLKAIEEWLRVLRPGGHLLLILPRKESNFDHRRPITAFEHLLEDHVRGTTEHDLTHLEEILELHDYDRDLPAGGREAMRQRSLANFENRCLHHHVFDPALIDRMLRHFRMQPLLSHTTRVNHIAAARKAA